MNLDNSELNQKEKISPLDEQAFMKAEFGESKYEAQDVGFYHWSIEDWKKLEPKVYSPDIIIGGFKWRVLLFPRGNNDRHSIALYLDCTPIEENDPNWSVCAQFILTIHSPNDPKVQWTNSVNHRFCSDEKDWGFTKFIEQAKLVQPFDENQVPLIVNDKTNISVYIKVIKDPTGVLWHNFKNYDSKAATGCVGLRNQGATCYMNSLLQSLFFTNYFRKSVYQIPTENDSPINSVVLALQRVFYNLQTSDNPVGTTELTKSFGWDSLDSFMQHDVQEFNRVLQDNLENKMKGTTAEGAVQKLFVGKMKSFIKCINVNYESSRIEDYYDIQLNVKGCADIKESFIDYCATETLEGDNKYMAEGYGLQDATKGVIFESFPPVLHLQLKRFEYDIHADSMVKINDRHEFLPTIDLAPFLSGEADKSQSYEYELHGVLVHSGDLNGGHYFAFIKSSPNSDWLKFDDDRVTKATLNEVYDDNFGGSDDNRMDITPMHRTNLNQHHSRFTNAYMLVYIRKSLINEILEDVTPEQIPSHIARTIQEERAALDARRREREEMQTMFNIKVVTDKVISNHEGYDLVDFSERNPDVPHIDHFKLLRTDTVGKLVQVVSEHYKIDPTHFRLWMFAYRENSTIRPDIFIPEDDYVLTLENIKEQSSTRWVDLRFYLQFSGDQSTIEQKFPKLDISNSNYIIIFPKFYDPKLNMVRCIGHEVVKANSKISDLIPILNARMNFPPDTQLRFFEELQPGKIHTISLRLSFNQNEIRSGDIICFHTEKALNKEDANIDQSKALLNYFESLSHQIHVMFKIKPNSGAQLEDFHFKLSRQTKYSDFSKLLADKIGTDPIKLRFYIANGPSGSPYTVVAYNPDTHLQDILHTPAAPNVALYSVYYELLDIDITQIELQRYIDVTWINEAVKDAVSHKIMVRKDGTVSQIVQSLNDTVQPNTPSPRNIRLYIGIHNRFHDFIEPETSISSIGDHCVVYGEFAPIQAVENNVENLLTIPVFQFHKEPLRSHGVPFLLDFPKDITLENLNQMVQHKLGLNDKDYEKARLFLTTSVQGTRPIPLETDEDWDTSKLGPKSAIGVDIIDRNAKPSRFADRAIKIFN